jgi:hypothetical protein
MFATRTRTHDEELNTIVSDLLCNLMHFCNRYKVDWEEVTRWAEGNYEDESSEHE